METKLQFSFAYIDNDLSLFELVEKYFPFEDYLKDFNKRLADDIDASFLDAELHQIKIRYEFIDNSRGAGRAYNHALLRRNINSSSLYNDFIFWKEINELGWIKVWELEKNNYSKKQIGEKFEREYLRQLAMGVNDAKFEKHLLKLKSSPFKKQNKDLPLLRIDKSKRLLIKNELEKYFEEKDLNKLTDIINDKPIQGKINFTSKASKLLEFFRRLKYNSTLDAQDSEITKILVEHFTFKGKEFNPVTISSYLSGKKEPLKKDMIALDNFPHKKKSVLK